MRFTEMLACRAASKPVLYHDVTRHQTPFVADDGPSWRVQGWKQYKHSIRAPRRATSPGSDAGKLGWLAAACGSDGPRAAPPAAAPMRPLRPFSWRVSPGLERGVWA